MYICIYIYIYETYIYIYPRGLETGRPSIIDAHMGLTMVSFLFITLAPRVE